MKTFFRKVTALIFPERCPYCSDLIEPCEIACEHCYSEIRRKHVPLKSGARGFRCISAFVYGGKVRRMILRLKYFDRIQYVPQVAELMADDIKSAYGENAFDLISFVLAEKSVVNKDTCKLLSDSLMNKKCGNGRVYAARKRAEYFFLAYLLFELSDSILYE